MTLRSHLVPSHPRFQMVDLLVGSSIMDLLTHHSPTDLARADKGLDGTTRVPRSSANLVAILFGKSVVDGWNAPSYHVGHAGCR